MGREIERKFLVRTDAWRDAVTEHASLRQGYLVAERDRSVRVRLAGARAWITIKGETRGAVRAEFEYPVPPEDAERMLDTLCLSPQIEKTRYLVPIDPHTWEIDVFEGDNAGLVVAEIELSREGEGFARPAWLGDEVTDDPRYLNARLIHAPFTTWGR